MRPSRRWPGGRRRPASAGPVAAAAAAGRPRERSTLVEAAARSADRACRPRPSFAGAALPARARRSPTWASRRWWPGSSEFGTYVGGGASLYFSDMLGNHNLVTGLQVNGGLKDVTALVGYQNLSHRLNWGAVRRSRCPTSPARSPQA